MDEQEAFWSGKFGDEYTDRNSGDALAAAKTELFARALRKAKGDVREVIELGSNRGLNMIALRRLLPDAKLTGVELNSHAFQELESIPGITAIHSSIYDLDLDKSFDLSFSCGVLIHLNPEKLGEAYDKLFNLSHRYVLVCEYYNPTPVEVTYRQQTGVLFKRDFAGEMLARFPSLSLVDYGFCYHGDKDCPVDDVTWFLMRKDSAAS